MQQLSVELRCFRVLGVPVRGQHEEVGADETQASIGLRLVDHDFRPGRIQLTVPDERHVHVVQSHCTDVGTGHTAEQQVVTLGFGGGRIPKLRGRLTHEPHELTGIVVAVVVRHRARCEQYAERTGRDSSDLHGDLLRARSAGNSIGTLRRYSA